MLQGIRKRFAKAVSALFLGLAVVGPVDVAQAAGTAAAPATRAGPLKAFDAKIEATKSAMMGDPLVARKAAESAVEMAKAMKSDPGISIRDSAVALATAQWLLGEALIGLNAPDKARPEIAQALDAVARYDRGSKLHGDLLRSRATLAEMGGNVQNALKDYLQAYDNFRAVGQTRSQAIALQDIGNLYLEARDFERVRRYYSQSLEAFDEDPWLNLATYNNRGQAYREERKFANAEAEYRLALAAARQLQSPLLEARILTNLADAQAEAGKLGTAAATISAATGLVKSGEGVGWRPFVYGVRGKIEARRGALAEASHYFDLAFAGQSLGKTEMPFRELHKEAARLYERTGRGELALVHLKAFQRLDSEALNLTASIGSQLMAARFDYANQNLRISKLKQGQLERDILIERQRTQFRTNLFIGLGTALMVIFGLLSFGYISIRRSRDQVRAANAELSVTNVELGKALKAKTDFLATTSHEIRTPLNGILGMAQVLLADRRLTRDMRERIQLLSGAGETMKSLVDDILDVAKMETGTISVDIAEASLSRLLTETVGLWREAAANKGLTLLCTLDSVPDVVRVDADRLRQILSNLLSNAIKFTAKGEVTLDVHGDFDGNTGRVTFAISDTGIGIAPEDQARIFEAFTQVNNSTTRQFSGSGLGLSICRKLSAALSGDVALSSLAGEGSCFTLTLPLERVGEKLARIDQGADAAAASLAEASLLLIDRNAAGHGLMRMLLTPETRSVTIATSLEEAVEYMKRERFDHVVIEGASAESEAASKLDGIRAITTQARAGGSRISLLAAPTDELPAEQLFAAGTDQVILKPVGAADLIAALKNPYDDAPKPSGAAAKETQTRAAA